MQQTATAVDAPPGPVPVVGPVLVVGQGRMGRAMAERLGEVAEVVTWGRASGQPLKDAADGATYVVLALFDGQACREVLAALDPGPGSVVVNTTTTSPDEAEELAALVEAGGAHYVHAPVMGSTPAVRAGSLTLLVGEPAPPPSVVPLLGHLGEVVTTSSPREAAALKLVANQVLANSLLTVQQALVIGERLGLDRGPVLDVLSRTAIGRVVSSGRSVLEEPARGQHTDHFAVEALAKDLALLERASAAHPRTAVAFRSTQRSRDWPGAADVALVGLPALPVDDTPAALLTLGCDVHGPDEALEPLRSYALGHATGDPAHFAAAFLPSAHVEGYRDGAFSSWTLDEFCAIFPGEPAPDEPERYRVVESLDVRDGVGTAVMSLHHGETVFIDMFVLLRDPSGAWRIANKIYERVQPG